MKYNKYHMIRRIIQMLEKKHRMGYLPHTFEDSAAVSRLKNTLILCNNDILMVGILCMVKIIADVHGIPLSIVAAKTAKMLKFMHPERDVIFTGGATDKIIERLKAGRSVLVFFAFNKYKKLEESSSYKKIMEETGCKPVYLSYNFSPTIESTQTFRLYKKIMGRRERNMLNMQKEMLVYNILFFLKLFLPIKQTIKLRVSRRMSDPSDIVANRKFIKSVFLQ